METKHTYIPQGTCSRLIEFTLDGTVVRDPVSYTHLTLPTNCT